MEKETKSAPLHHLSSGMMSRSGSREVKISEHLQQKRRFSGSPNQNKNGGKGSNSQPNNKAVRVLDAEGKDVTPLSLGAAPPESPQSKEKRLTLDDVLFNTGLFCNSFSTKSPMESGLLSRSSKTENSFPLQDVTPYPTHSEVLVKTQRFEAGMPEENLDQGFKVTLSETDTFSLLDLTPTLIAEDAKYAEGVKQRNISYAEFCKNRMGNDNYVERSVHAFVGEPKTKHTQTDRNSSVSKGTTATNWKIYDSFCVPNVTKENQDADQRGYNVATKKEQDVTEVTISGDTGSIVSSVADMETCGESLKAEPDQDKILLSESFMDSLLLTERVIVVNVFQPKLAAFRGLPVLTDPYSMVNPGSEEQGTKDKDDHLSPTMERLWAFICPLTRGKNITSMTWNKKNPDILAVGYGDWTSGSPKPGFICCWCLKNLTWSDRVFSCHSSVTCLDFSASNPSHLAVGMYDGSVAIFNVEVKNHMACIANSRDCSKRHQQPVWQVIWTKQQLQLAGEEREEVLVSVSGDGRITKWLILSNGFNCIDLMVVKRIRDHKKNSTGNQEKLENVLLPVTPVLCVDFHPQEAGIYVIGTWDGCIHKCSLSNNEHFLDTYNKHFSPVTHVEWSPLCPDVFLSCSSDWTIHLWKLDSLTPKMSFTSVQNPVDGVKWSPNSSTVFAANYKQRVEVWDLSSSILFPTVVHHAEPGVKLASVLFAKGSDCVLVGDSEGEVTVYQLKNFRVRKEKLGNELDDIMQSVPGYVPS